MRRKDRIFGNRQVKAVGSQVVRKVGGWGVSLGSLWIERYSRGYTSIEDGNWDPRDRHCRQVKGGPEGIAVDL